MEIKREHDDMQNNGRKLVTDLLEKEKEIKSLRKDFQSVMDENSQYKQKFIEQEDALQQLKKANLQTQEEFDTFKADMQTKNSLISTLKEQITEITQEQRKQEEKEKRYSEID